MPNTRSTIWHKSPELATNDCNLVWYTFISLNTQLALIFYNIMIPSLVHKWVRELQLHATVNPNKLGPFETR